MKRVFIANRGEIAVRIVRACRALGLECVVGVSEADRDGLAARLADRGVCIGPAPAARRATCATTWSSQAALGTGCDAIHPGYGFLSESPRLARRRARARARLRRPAGRGDRAGRRQARRPAQQAARGRAAGAARRRESPTPRRRCELAAEIGYPVLLKAAGGGGGRGIKLRRRRRASSTRCSRWRAPRRGAAFGDDRVYVERFVAAARHVEVQIAADEHGDVVHLGERDCSVQRRYQKLIEEAPAPALRRATARRDSRRRRSRSPRAIGYRNLGTVEFVLDADTGEFFFLEVNCRIQVEHPVTEAVTGRDLVALQLRIADGEPLGFARRRSGSTATRSSAG